MKMIAATATTDPYGADYFFTTCRRGSIDHCREVNIPNKGLVAAYQTIYEVRSQIGADVIVFMHDDVEVFEPDWAEKIDFIFDTDADVAIIGLGGATGIGTPDIYKTPYHITQLQRINYVSNQRDWAVHGTRETGIRDVAVVDGFFMAVRVKFLDEVGGWKWFPHNFHSYDTGLCLMAIRRGWKVKMIGLDCHHHGGGTSTKPEYEKWCRERGTDMAREHSEPHLWMYEEFRDLLPYEAHR